MADETLRRAERAAKGGDRDARRDWRRGQLRVAPGDVTPLLDDLQLDAWNSLVADERREVAEQLGRVLELRRRPMELIDVRGFGPDASQPIARYRDQATGLVFALIPGGRFRPGVSPEQVAALRALGELDGDEDEGEADDDPVTYGFPARGREVTVEPFLFSVLPVTVGCSALPSTVDEAGLTETIRQTYGEDAPWYVDERDLDAALRGLRCELPSTAQVAWAARGGRDQLYPWGNDLEVMDEARASRSWDAPPLRLGWPAAEVEATGWPAANAFGLLVLGGPTQWCVGPDGGRTSWAGSGEGWPWQDPGDSFFAVIGVFHPPIDGACLRPLITLGGR